MKILLVTDIHDDHAFAHNAWYSENPDLVLDCGDHEDIKNISELTPHYFVSGNHEPSAVHLDPEGFPLPHELNPRIVYIFEKGGKKVSFTGIGGNYSSKQGENNVNLRDVEFLSKINRGDLDVLLLHESPLNLHSNKGGYDLAQRVVKEIKRIMPKYVFSGHSGRFKESKMGNKGEHIPTINLEDIAYGYGVLEDVDGTLNFRRVISKYRG